MIQLIREFLLFRYFNKLYHGYIEVLDEDNLTILRTIKPSAIDTYLAYLTPKVSRSIIDGEISVKEAQGYYQALNDIRTLALKAERHNNK